MASIGHYYLVTSYFRPVSPKNFSVDDGFKARYGLSGWCREVAALLVVGASSHRQLLNRVRSFRAT